MRSIRSQSSPPAKRIANRLEVSIDRNRPGFRRLANDSLVSDRIFYYTLHGAHSISHRTGAIGGRRFVEKSLNPELTLAARKGSPTHPRQKLAIIP
jgi:hypothetical protein